MNNARKTIALELHRAVRRNFVRRAVELKGLHDLYQADLVEMIPYARANKGYKYMMTAVSYTHLDVYKRQPPNDCLDLTLSIQSPCEGLFFPKSCLLNSFVISKDCLIPFSVKL